MKGIKISLESILFLFTIITILWADNFPLLIVGLEVIVIVLLIPHIKRKGLSPKILVAILLIPAVGIFRLYGIGIIMRVRRAGQPSVIITSNIGEPIPLDDSMIVTLESVKVTDKITVPIEFYGKPLRNYSYQSTPNYKFVLLNFKIENIKAKILGYFLWDEFLTVDNGSIYREMSEIDLVEKNYSTIEVTAEEEGKYFCETGAQINPGEVGKTCTFFEIPETTNPIKYEFQPWIWIESKKKVSISLVS